MTKHGKWLMAAGAALVLTALYFLDPVQYLLMPKCPFKLLTGYSCPGCGLQRAAHALLHGRFREAIQYNFFLLLGVPYFLAAFYASFIARGRNKERWRCITSHRYLIYAYVFFFFLWWILRNWLRI